LHLILFENASQAMSNGCAAPLRHRRSPRRRGEGVTRIGLNGHVEPRWRFLQCPDPPMFRRVNGVSTGRKFVIDLLTLRRGHGDPAVTLNNNGGGMDHPYVDPRPQMNALLRRCCDELLELEGKVTRDTVETRYEMGGIIKCVQEGGDTYGTGAVELLALALGRPASTLYRWARIAGKWPGHEFGKLRERTNRHGLPVTWTHFTELEPLADWKSWFELALAGGWSSAHLKKEIVKKATKTEGDVSGEREIPTGTATTCAALRQAIDAAEHCDDQLAKYLGPVLDRLNRAEDPLDREADVDSLVLLSRTVIENLVERASKLHERLMSTPLKAASGPPPPKESRRVPSGAVHAGGPVPTRPQRIASRRAS
jgi:hypothetical protein